MDVPAREFWCADNHWYEPPDAVIDLVMGDYLRELLTAASSGR